MFNTEIFHCPDGTKCPWNNLPKRLRSIAPDCKPGGECLRESEEAATAEFLTELAEEKGVPPAPPLDTTKIVKS